MITGLMITGLMPPQGADLYVVGGICALMILGAMPCSATHDGQVPGEKPD